MVILKIEYRLGRRQGGGGWGGLGGGGGVREGMQPHKLQCCMLYIKGLNQTESPVFVILCVLCFHRHYFTDPITADDFPFKCTTVDRVSESVSVPT